MTVAIGRAIGPFLVVLAVFSRKTQARRMLWHQAGPRVYRVDPMNSQPQDMPHELWSRDTIARELAAHGLKPTDQRIRIAAILMSVPAHMTAEQILAAVRSGGQRVSKATLYNTLKVLAQRGLVRQIHLDPERCVYDSTRAPHHHFHDLETGELHDINPDDISFNRFPTLPDGMEAEAVEVVIRLRKKRTGDSP